MKKITGIILFAAVIFALTGCGNSGDDIRGTVNTQTNVADVLAAGTQGDMAESSVPSEITAKVKEEAGLGTIDVDLTALSSTVVYSEVYNMTTAPNDYKDKIVKMGGQCTIYTDSKTDKTYYACLIKDAAACCAQGIEFVLTDDCVMPDDYPREGDEIEVVGTFDTYMEDGIEYSTLRDASVVSLQSGSSDING